MNLRPLLLVCVLMTLTGCVSVGPNSVMFTPVGVIGVHSFAPQERVADEAVVDRRAASNVSMQSQPLQSQQ